MLSLACVGWTGQHSVWGVQQPSRNKSAGVNSGPKSRALETNASPLNGRPHGVSGSSRSFCRWRSQLGIGYELIGSSPGQNLSNRRFIFHRLIHCDEVKINTNAIRQTIGANAGYVARVAFSLRRRAGCSHKIRLELMTMDPDTTQ